MAEYDFRQVHVFLIDREHNTRRLLRGILIRMGIEKVSEFTNTAEAQSALAVSMPDLLITDVEPEWEGFRLIHALRHAIHATNPFIVTIATTWQPTSQFMMRFTGSGADDIIVKPFSTKQVQDRVLHLIEQRKPFVVTSDYIGPDRRRSPREGQQIPLTDVPNTLRLKALGMLERGAIGDQIGKAMLSINQQKVVRLGFQGAFLMLFALPGLAQEPPDRMAVEHLLRVQPAVEDMLRRMPAGDTRVQADLYVRVLHNGIESFKLAPQQPIADAETLHRAAIGLAALTAQRTDVAALEQEVAAAVTAYRTRLEQIVQAKTQTPQAGEADGAESSSTDQAPIDQTPAEREVPVPDGD